MTESTERKVTRNDVARLAGVSTAVVSYVVNNGPRPVSEASRHKVLDAIEKLNYQPNAAARSLITGRANMLALVVPDIVNNYFGEMALEVEAAARAAGQSLLLAQAADNHHEVIAELGGGMVDGIISAVQPDDQTLREISRQRIPFVQISIMTPRSPYRCLQPDYYAGAKLAVHHLIAHGHKRIALVTGDLSTGDRARGWSDALTEAGLVLGPVVDTTWTLAGGFRAAQELAEYHKDVTAIFVAADQLAKGLLAGLDQAGIRVPADVAVASFDGAPEGEFTVPPLTSIRVPIRRLAQDAVAQVMKPEEERSGHVYPGELITRRSCGCSPE